MNQISQCSGEGCHSCEMTGNESFIFLPHLGKRFCFACAVEEMQKIKPLDFSEEITLGFDPAKSQFKKIFEYSRTARNLWLLYKRSCLYGGEVANYFLSEEFLFDCQKFDDSFGTHHGSVEACVSIFRKVSVDYEWWLSARLFLGPKDVYYPGRGDLSCKIQRG